MAEALHKILSLGPSATGNITQMISNIQFNIQSKFERRNAVKRIITTKFGHNFERVLFKEPTCCSRCGGFITWEQFGDRGQRCKLCQLVSHDRCLDSINSRCARESRKSKVEQPMVDDGPEHSHKFERVTFFKPTFCQHCGNLIVGFHKQGQECSVSGCGMTIHHNCRELVNDFCPKKEHRASTTMQRDMGDNKDEITSGVKNNSEQQQQQQDWSLIKIEDFELIRVLATGSFSKVYLARKRNPITDSANPLDYSKQFAIKVVNKIEPVVCSDPGSTMTEMKVLQFGRSYPFLAIAHCCFQSRDRLFFVMEYVEGRDLLYHIRKARKFTENRTRFYAAEIVLALIYLHNRKIIYRDLKLDNVILDKYGHCKLLDFGMSKDLSLCKGERTRTFCGTPSYISPEICKGVDYDYSVDWWSLGVLMFEMLIGYSPFDGYNDNDEDKLYRMIREEQVKYPSSLSYEAKSVLQGLMTKDPSQRLGCKIMEDREREIQNHPFFLREGPHTDWWEHIQAKRIEPPYKPTSDDLEPFDNLDGVCHNLTPIESDQLKHIHQEDFKGFSFYSESFDSDQNILF